MKRFVYASTSAPTPRKHAQPNPATDPALIVTYTTDHGVIVNANWLDPESGVRTTVSISADSLRAMLAFAEAAPEKYGISARTT